MAMRGDTMIMKDDSIVESSPYRGEMRPPKHNFSYGQNSSKLN